MEDTTADAQLRRLAQRLFVFLFHCAVVGPSLSKALTDDGIGNGAGRYLFQVHHCLSITGISSNCDLHLTTIKSCGLGPASFSLLPLYVCRRWERQYAALQQSGHEHLLQPLWSVDAVEGLPPWTFRRMCFLQASLEHDVRSFVGIFSTLKVTPSGLGADVSGNERPNRAL